jgi:hypothetical protein
VSAAEPITPDQAALVMLFWSLGCGAIGYALCAWRTARLERRRRAHRRAVEKQMLEALAQEPPRG